MDAGKPISKGYSARVEADRIFNGLINDAERLNLPRDALGSKVFFTPSADEIYYPTPFKVTETLAALKGVEGAMAAAIADLRFGAMPGGREIRVSLERATLFGFQALLAKVDGYSRSDPEIRRYLKDTDIHSAQSNLYRRRAANMYRTKNEDEYFFLHGSLNPTKALNMIGLPSHRPGLTEYDDIVDLIGTQVGDFSAAELEDLNQEFGQAGVTVYTHEEFCATPHGKANVNEPWWTVSRMPDDVPPTPFQAAKSNRALGGIKVLELCCVIAGPVIGRILAEYGADVLKITCSSSVPDVPFFQVDGNMGKRAVDLDLKSPSGRQKFEKLLEETDVVIDGFRPGVLEKLGYTPSSLSDMAIRRGKGIVYVDENCFGHMGRWAGRPGWQQIADCLTGFAWEFGKFLGHREPIVSPWPIADYGAGCMGAITALIGLYNRARFGGSYHGKVSLMQFNLLLFAVGQYPEEIQAMLRGRVSHAFRSLRHCDGVDRSTRIALADMQQQFPELFKSPKRSTPNENLTEVWYSHCFGTDVEVVRPVACVEGIENCFVRASRCNGADSDPSWSSFQLVEDFRKV
ncbi:CoA-transferase family III [Aspergillus aculeatinus CBS 121060]|uniref:CoA-transferase family III n=1 Tax=Aspergillus aculeatinus CBS 121060 TaxID=1448322 RepID=A0ACD1H1U8_9EURO|nr:CoA-transferase family III [Aspergillus aculeatinus CBS 121060]RAH67575.1 CoA-transferase family III [Aspergillus aculeatinus CBS 121060]